jgi:hypothetical protein
MAMCSKCKTNVGCGCQLKEGLCGGCYSVSSKKPKIKDLTKDIKNDKNAISKTS